MEMARILGRSRQALHKLVQAKVVFQVGRGRFDVADTVQRVLAHSVASAEERSGPSPSDRLRELKAAEIEQRMAERDRRLIDLEESLHEIDVIVGMCVEMMDGLPARITRDQRERARIEAIIDEARARLANKLEERSEFLRTGVEPSAA